MALFQYTSYYRRSYQEAEVVAYAAGASSLANQHGKFEQFISPSTPLGVYQGYLLNASYGLPR